MPMGLVKTPRDEELWAKARAAAKKQGHTEDWAYINGIYQRMKGNTKKTASLLGAIQKYAGSVSGIPDSIKPIGWSVKPLAGGGRIMQYDYIDPVTKEWRGEAVRYDAHGKVIDSPTSSKNPKQREMDRLRYLMMVQKMKGNSMKKKATLLEALIKKAGKVPGVPDATGPYGRGLGPGKGTKSGLGLLMAKLEKGEKLTEEEKALLAKLKK